MPLYEYRCRSCGQLFERLLPMGATDPACPDGHTDVARLLSVFARGASSAAGAGDVGAGGTPVRGGGCCGGACGCG